MMTRVGAVGLMLAASLFGQLKFEVASVKPSAGNSGTGGTTNDAGTLTMPRSTTRVLIAAAYDVLNIEITGGPRWIDSELFDVQAKAAGPATQSEKMEMLRSLLADRFRLKVHREPGTIRAYALVVAKGEPKMQALKPGGSTPEQKPGVFAGAVSMKRLASIVSAYLSMSTPSNDPSAPEVLPVIDQTGLTGEYAVSLDVIHTKDWFTFLEQQLGLKLEARKIPVEMVAIDSVERPAGN